MEHPRWGLSISGSVRGRRPDGLLDRLHHQDLALAFGDLVQREHSLGGTLTLNSWPPEPGKNAFLLL